MHGLHIFSVIFTLWILQIKPFYLYKKLKKLMKTNEFMMKVGYGNFLSPKTSQSRKGVGESVIGANSNSSADPKFLRRSV
jgi:hypothetical protein